MNPFKRKPRKPKAVGRKIDEVRESLRRAATPSVGWNMVGKSGPGGLRLDIEEDPQLDVLLSGTVSPYSWTQQYATNGGGWAAVTGGAAGTSDAYEYNAIAGLGGKHATIHLDDTGTWRFTFNRRGTSCSGAINVNVRGCCEGVGALGLSGLSVTIKQGGVTLWTGTTDAGGNYSHAITSSGSYEVDVAGGTFYANASLTQTCGCFTNQYNFTLTPATGYTCCCACGFDGVATPTSLTLNDPWGDLALTYIGLIDGNPSWTGCRTVSVTASCLGTGTVDSFGNCLTGPGGTVLLPLHYSLGCMRHVVGPPAFDCPGGASFCWQLNTTGGYYCLTGFPGSYQCCPVGTACGVVGPPGTSPFLAFVSAPSSTSCSPTCLVFNGVQPYASVFCPPLVSAFTVKVRDSAIPVGSCPTSAATCTVHVTGCAGLDLPDATCTFTGPGTTTSCVTDGTGHCTVNLDATGSWTLVVTASRFNSNTQSVTIATGANTASAAMVVASGYVCWYGCAYPGPTTTLQLTDGNTGTGAAITLTYNALGPYYEGCYTTPHAVSGATVIRSGLPCSAQPVFSNIYYRFDPIATGNNPGVLAAIFPACDNSAFPPQGAASCPRPGTGWPIEQSATATSTTETCPLNMATHWQGTIELPPASNTGYHGVLLNGTVNITE